MDKWMNGRAIAFLSFVLSPTPPYPHTPTLTFLVLALLITPAGTVNAQPTLRTPGVRVFTADELHQAGVTRLSGLFDLLDGWQAVSTNGYAWNVSAAGLSPLRRSGWMLFVDGRPVSLDAPGTSPIDMAPVHLYQLDSVVVHSVPHVATGRFVPAGAIYLYTHRPRPGVGGRGGFSAGNEIGDPGPYAFTDRATVNVDRFGPHYFGEVTYAQRAWHVRLSLKGNEHYATDARIRERITYYSTREPPLLVLLAPRLEIGTQGPLGRHTLAVSHTRLEDLRFFAPLGYEVPALHRRTSASLHGAFSDAPVGTRYRLGYTRHRLGRLDPGDTLSFDWQQHHLSGSLSYTIRSGDAFLERATVGVSGDYYRTHTAFPLRDDALLTTRLYGRVALDLPWHQAITAFLARTNGTLGVRALSTSTFVPAARHTATLTLSYARQPFAATNAHWYWAQQGYTFAHAHGTPLTLPPAYSTERTFTAVLGSQARLSPSLGVTLRGGFRRFLGRNLATYDFGFDAAGGGLSPATRIRSDAAGSVWTGSLTAHLYLLPHVKQRVHLGLLHPVADTPAFQESWRAAPRTRFSYTVRYRPVSSLSLRGRLTYRAPTRWPSYRRAGAAPEGRYPSRLPAQWLLGVTVRKTFWADHLGATLSLRNLLGEPLRTHPAGPATRLMLHVSLYVFFN